MTDKNYDFDLSGMHPDAQRGAADAAGGCSDR